MKDGKPKLLNSQYSMDSILQISDYLVAVDNLICVGINAIFHGLFEMIAGVVSTLDLPNGMNQSVRAQVFESQIIGTEHFR